MRTKWARAGRAGAEKGGKTLTDRPINFNAQDMVAEGKTTLRITDKMVAVLAEACGDEELGRFVL